MRITGNLLILLGNALRGINQHEHNIGTVDCAQRTHDAVALHRLIDLTTTAHTSRIDQHEFHAVLDEMRIDRITRRSGNITDDHALFTEQLIDDR